MPTRRAFRPDSQYYRTTRRQNLSRGARAARGGGKALAVVALGVAGFLLVKWAMNGGLWAAVFGWAGVALVACLAVLVILAGRR